MTRVRSNRRRPFVPPPPVKPVKKPLWKKAGWAAGAVAALGMAGLVYARYFWGRDEVTQKTVEMQEFFGRYNPEPWDQIERGEPADIGEASAAFERPFPIPIERVEFDNLLLREPEAVDRLTGEELPPPPAVHITIPPGGSIAEVRESAYRAGLPSFGVSSTNEIDFRRYTKRIVNLRDAAGLLQLSEYTVLYLVAYPESLLDGEEQGPPTRLYYALPVRGFFDAGENRLEGAQKRVLPLWTTTFQRGSRKATVNFFLTGLCKETIEGLTGWVEMGPYLFVQHYSQAIDQAAAIVAQAHPQAHLQNLRILMRWRLMLEMGAVEAEDLWQDRSACKFAGCNRQALFDAAVRSADIPVGVADPIFGRIWNLPTLSWRFISKTYKGNLDRQGLGPAQNIVGLVRRAGRDPSIVRRYAPHLTADDFRDSRAIVRAVLDPTKAVHIRAMTLDMILGELERTFFSDPKVTFPANQVPFIANAATAREYARIFLANRLWSFPEEDRYLPALLTGDAPAEFPYYAKLFAIGGLFGIEPEFPGMFVPRVQLGERTIIFPTYQVVQ